MLKYAKTLLEKGIQQEELFKHHSLEETSREEPSYHPETVIASNVVIKGSLSFEKCLRIDGIFEGTLESQGKLIVGPSGVVRANLEMTEVIVAGEIDGDITATGQVILHASAKVRGDITAPFLSMEPGASLLGQVTISPPAQETTS